MDKEVKTPTNPKDLKDHTKQLSKSKWISFDLVKNHLIPHIVEKKIMKDMYYALVTIY